MAMGVNWMWQGVAHNALLTVSLLLKLLSRRGEKQKLKKKKKEIYKDTEVSTLILATDLKSCCPMILNL